MKPETQAELDRLQAVHDRSFAKHGGYRCYDGCPDTALQARLDRDALLMKEIKKYEPDAHCTLHRNPDNYCIHVWGIELSDSPDKTQALEKALKALEAKHQ